MKKQTNTQRLQNKIIKLQEEINSCYIKCEMQHQNVIRITETHKKSLEEFEQLRTLAAHLCRQAIIFKNAPSLAKEFIGQDDAINHYLRYLVAKRS